MVINSLEVILIILFLISCFYIFYKIVNCKKEIEEKNIKLIQFYLDSKFINKTLVDSLKYSNSINFSKDLIEQIRSYYNLDEIVIINSVARVNKTFTTKTNIQFTKEFIESMVCKLNGHSIQEFKMQIMENEYILYMSKLSSEDQNDGIVIGVESAPSILNKNEKLGLENLINLLKYRLLYD
jgi:hypothetical protein